MQIAMYLVRADGTVWGPQGTVVLSPAYFWRIDSWWATQADEDAPTFHIVLLPAATTPAAASGAQQVPANVTAAAIASTNYQRVAGSAASATRSPSPAPVHASAAHGTSIGLVSALILAVSAGIHSRSAL